MHPFMLYNDEINDGEKNKKYEATCHQTKHRIHKEVLRAKSNYYTQNAVECGKDQKARFKVIDSFQGQNNGSIF